MKKLKMIIIFLLLFLLLTQNLLAEEKAILKINGSKIESLQTYNVGDTISVTFFPGTTSAKLRGFKEVNASISVNGRARVKKDVASQRGAQSQVLSYVVQKGDNYIQADVYYVDDPTKTSLGSFNQLIQLSPTHKALVKEVEKMINVHQGGRVPKERIEELEPYIGGSGRRSNER